MYNGESLISQNDYGIIPYGNYMYLEITKQNQPTNHLVCIGPLVFPGKDQPLSPPVPTHPHPLTTKRRLKSNIFSYNPTNILQFWHWFYIIIFFDVYQQNCIIAFVKVIKMQTFKVAINIKQLLVCATSM